MKYSNASKGLQKMVIAEFIALAASLLAVIMSALALSGDESSETMNATFGLSVAVMIVIVVLYVVSSVMEVFGIISAAKDESAFKVSLYAIIASIIFTILAAFFYENETVFLIISIAGDVAYFFLVHYIIHGIMHLSEHFGRPEFSKKGNRIFTVIYIGIIFEIIVRIIEIIYGQKQGEELALPFDMVANILKTIEYVMFLIYIIKGNRLLKDSKAE